MSLTQERLKELLHYDPETGVFTWRVARQGWIKAGDQAGSVQSTGYRLIGLAGRRYRASRLAFLYMLGRWPRADVDHKNRVRDDDMWHNLREANDSQNQGNRTGTRGVYKRGNHWETSIAGRYLGRFPTQEKAQAAYVAAARKRFGEFANV